LLASASAPDPEPEAEAELETEPEPEPSLPPGWHRTVSMSGRTVYVNHDTRSAQYDPPTPVLET
jgi:hypothetical protein